MAQSRTALISALSYRDARAALAWLQNAFGFEIAMLIEDAAGGVAHSEMSYGDCLVMIGNEWSLDYKSPASIGGKNTQSVHIQVETDIDGHCARARGARGRAYVGAGGVVGLDLVLASASAASDPYIMRISSSVTISTSLSYPQSTGG